MLEAKLIIVGGDAKRTEVNLRNLPATIGRAREASITLPHKLVSRQHCEIYLENEHLFVKDLNSLNGTYLNNEKISGSVKLLPGQLLTLGNVTFRADYAVQPEAEISQPAALAGEVTQHSESSSDDLKQADVDTDHGLPDAGSDTDEHVFVLNDPAINGEKSISLNALKNLPDSQQSCVSGNWRLESEQGYPQPIPSAVNIDLGDGQDAEEDLSQSSLNDFFRQQPK